MNSIFQQADFFSFLKSTGFLEPFRFSVERSGKEVGVVQGFIQKDGGKIKQYLSRRAIINGGPWLAEDITDTELEKLLKKCIYVLKRKTIYIETRNFFDYSRFRPVFEKMGFVYEPHYDIIVEVNGNESWEKRMESSRPRFVKSSLNNGVEVINNPTEDEVIEYYAVLKDLYTTKIKTPLFSLDFFMKLYHTSFCRFILVRYQNKIVGGMVCVFDNDTAYEWFVCGMDGIYKHIYPSTVATYSAIKFSYEKGLKRFDMMGAGSPGDGGYGVREFKLKFGGNLVEFGRFIYICKPLLYGVGKMGVKIMKKS